MLYPSVEIEVMNRHHEIIRNAETYRKHFGETRPGRTLSAVLAFLARITGAMSRRLDAAVASLDGNHQRGTHASAA